MDQKAPVCRIGQRASFSRMEGLLAAEFTMSEELTFAIGDSVQHNSLHDGGNVKRKVGRITGFCPSPKWIRVKTLDGRKHIWLKENTEKVGGGIGEVALVNKPRPDPKPAPSKSLNEIERCIIDCLAEKSDLTSEQISTSSKRDDVAVWLAIVGLEKKGLILHGATNWKWQLTPQGRLAGGV
jgi:hypothetical protein